MEEIKIYHSVWKYLPTILILLVFTIIFVYAITQGKDTPLWALGGLLFFGLGFLFMLFMVLRERFNAQEGIHASKLTIKPKQLCDLLNERLKQRLAPQQS